MKLKTIIMRTIFITVFLLLSYSFLKSQNVGIGNTDPKAKLDVSGDLILKSADLTLADGNTLDLDINTNKYNHYKLIGPTGNFQIGGIVAAEHDRIITFYNRSGHSLEVYNDDVNALSSNKILTGTGGTFAVYPGGSVTLKYDNIIGKWEIIASHYNSLDNFGSGNWSLSGNDIYNGNVGNVGIATTTPLTSLHVNGNFSLASDTINSPCNTIIPPSMNNDILIDNTFKKKSMFHIVKDTSCSFSLPPEIMGLIGGTDGQIVTIFTHINYTQVKHLQGLTFNPTALDSTYMIELFEPNFNGNINEPTQITFNTGGAITLIYDGIRNRWKPINYYGEIKNDLAGWYKGPNQNDIYNPNAGNVGIGTGLPTEKLEVYGNIEVSGEIKPNGNAGVNGDVLTSLGNGSMNWLPNAGWPTSGNDIKNGNTGNVGIGGFPSSGIKLDVEGNGEFNGSVISDIEDKGVLALYTSSGIGLRHLTMDGQRIQSAGGNNVFPYNPTPKNIYINPLGGNVGIGIESLTHRLEVNGTIRSKEVIVEAVNWPDYVFSKEYELPSLASIEKFINEHKHLPNIPSAIDVETNGQFLGETQRKMMEKIEELTLYILQLNKEVELLKNNQNK